MSKIIYIPLENMEQRYTPMFNKAFSQYADDYLYPDFEYDTVIETGEFLDVNKTIIFKSKQLQMIAELFHHKRVSDGDIFIVSDIFFPGIESIKYMAELQDIKVKVFAFNHAGRADKTDFVQKLGHWADHSEQGYHCICDGIFFGSVFHARRAENFFMLEEEDIHCHGMIWNRDFVNNIYQATCKKKNDVIVWPHRPSKEKGFDEFIHYAKNNPDKKFLITSSGNKLDLKLPKNVDYKWGLTKAEYYQILDESRYYLSNAYQETFGYTLQEAIHYGCEIAVPNRACYPEMVPSECLFDEIDNISFHKVDESWTERFNGNVHNIINTIRAQR